MTTINDVLRNVLAMQRLAPTTAQAAQAIFDNLARLNGRYYPTPVMAARPWADYGDEDPGEDAVHRRAPRPDTDSPLADALDDHLRGVGR